MHVLFQISQMKMMALWRNKYEFVTEIRERGVHAGT